MWEVQLTGNQFDLDELALSMTDTDPSIQSTSSGVMLRASAFDSMTSHVEVDKAAREMLASLNGICAVLLSSREPITIGAIIDALPGQARQIYELLSDRVHARDALSMQVTHVDGSVETSHQADPAATWLNLARVDPQVAKALRLLNNPRDPWNAMYKTLEVIQKNMGGISQVAQIPGVSQPAIKRFTQTANSHAAVGDLARHGTESVSAPAVPMTMSEAKALIHTIMHSWLRAKEAV